MFKDGEKTLKRILELTELCPPQLQEKCFEILLHAYVSGSSGDPKVSRESSDPAENKTQKEKSNAVDVPEGVRARLVSTAARLNVTQEQLAKLFDFSVDPFSYHALAVPGENKKEKTKNVAFLLAAKSYLSGGGWDADWKEFRAMCIDQNCFDKANNPTTMKAEVFKSASPSGITLSSSGVRAAELLLAQLAGG